MERNVVSEVSGGGGREEVMISAVDIDKKAAELRTI